MTRFKIGAAVLGLMIGVLAAAPANAWKRGSVEVLAVVPGNDVEGLTVGPDGNIYVSTFGFNAQGAVPGEARLLVFSPNGKLLRNVRHRELEPAHARARLQSGRPPRPAGHRLRGRKRSSRSTRNTGDSSVFMGPIPNSGLNALTFDKDGNVYVSDSFNGNIWKTDSGGSGLTAWSSDPLLG